MQPYRKGEPFGELTQVSMDDVKIKIQEAFNHGADEVRVYDDINNVIGNISSGKDDVVDVYNNRAGRRALKFKNKNRRNHV